MSKEINPTFGERVKYLRKSRVMTLQELGDKTNSSKGYIWEVENNRINVSLEKAIKIADVFGISLDDLVRKDLVMATYSYKRCGFKTVDGKLQWYEEERPSGGEKGETD